MVDKSSDVAAAFQWPKCKPENEEDVFSFRPFQYCLNSSLETVALQLFCDIPLAAEPNCFNRPIVCTSVFGGNLYVPFNICSAAFVAPKNPNSSFITDSPISGVSSVKWNRLRLLFIIAGSNSSGSFTSIATPFFCTTTFVIAAPRRCFTALFIHFHSSRIRSLVINCNISLALLCWFLPSASFTFFLK